MGSINYITTLINMRRQGMTWFRLPLTIWSLFVVAVLLLLALRGVDLWPCHDPL